MPAGRITSRIARFVTDEVLPRADVVIDLHAGGAGFEIMRTMSFHAVADPERFAQFRETALLFGTPFVMIYTSGMGTGLLTEEAEAMGKITIGSELGFGASTDLDGVRWAHQGTLNVLRHYGLLDGEIEILTPPGLDRQRVVSAVDIDRYVTAPVSGISEPLVPVGAYVTAGTPVVRIHDFERWDEPAVEIAADGDGYVMARKFRAATEQGEVVMVIAEELSYQLSAFSVRRRPACGSVAPLPRRGACCATGLAAERAYPWVRSRVVFSARCRWGRG